MGKCKGGDIDRFGSKGSGHEGEDGDLLEVTFPNLSVVPDCQAVKAWTDKDASINLCLAAPLLQLPRLDGITSKP